jgi:hypothetical protein
VRVVRSQVEKVFEIEITPEPKIHISPTVFVEEEVFTAKAPLPQPEPVKAEILRKMPTIPPPSTGTMPTVRVTSDSESFNIVPAHKGKLANHPDKIAVPQKYWERPVNSGGNEATNYSLVGRPLVFFSTKAVSGKEPHKIEDKVLSEFSLLKTPAVHDLYYWKTEVEENELNMPPHAAYSA